LKYRPPETAVISRQGFRQRFRQRFQKFDFKIKSSTDTCSSLVIFC
jgi:hypothetical protein